jgi:hypothetical protein
MREVDVKKNLDALLLANPKAAKHKNVIKQTLDDVDRLRKAGVTSTGYRLSSPFGAKAKPIPLTGRRPKLKMTYCS